jgi:hypothetical protein
MASSRTHVNATARSNIRGPSTAADVFSSFSQDFATISSSLPVPGRVDLKSILKEASSLAQKGLMDFVDADRLRKEEEEKQKHNSNANGGGGGSGIGGSHMIDDSSLSTRMDSNSDFRVVIPPKPVVQRSAADEAESLLLADLKAAGIEYTRNDQPISSLSSVSSGSSQLPNSSSTSSGASLQNVQDSVFRTAEDLLSKASDQFNNAAANLPAVRDELSQWQRRLLSSVGAGGIISLSSAGGGSGQATTGAGQDSDEIKVKKLSILPSSIPVSSSLSTRPLSGMLNPASLSASSTTSATSNGSTLWNSCALLTRFVAFLVEVTLVVIKFVGRMFINIAMRLVGRAGSDVVLSSTVESIAGLTMIGLFALLYYYFFSISASATLTTL